MVGATLASMVFTEKADASIPTPHLNTHLDKNRNTFDNLSINEQLGAEIDAGFNTLNAVQAGAEFRTGASKSVMTLLDKEAYREGLQQTIKHVPEALITREAVKLGVMDSIKFSGKSLLKKLPFVGLVAGIGFGINRALHGDLKGAGMEVASGAMSLIPGIGTAGSVAMDAALLEKDTGLLTHGTQKLLGKKREIFIQSEDNHTTIESCQRNLLEDTSNDKIIPCENHTIPINDMEFSENKPFDNTSHAQRIIDDMSEKHSWDSNNEIELEIEQ